jgi:type I restriction enzyme, S subunit
MSEWETMKLAKVICFNPPERIKKGSLAKKIAMDKLIAFKKKINGFEIVPYSAGPKFKNGDTLLAKITPCLENGKTAQVDILKTNEVAFGSSEFIVLRENAYSINDFIFYLAKSPVFRKRAISCMEGTSGRKRVNENALKLQEVLIPSIKIQQRIAAVLSSLDAKIELNTHINAELEAMTKTLYDYWFVQFDFPDRNGKPYKSSGGKMVWNAELKREIPEGWDSITINQILTKERTTIKIQASDILQRGSIPVIDQSIDYIAGYTNDIESMIKTEVPRIIFGDHTRILKLINFDFARGADGTQVMLSDSIRMPQYLFFYTLLKIDLSNYGYARHYKFLKDHRIILPDDKIAKTFNDLAHNYYELIKRNIFENRALSELRDWLLPMLINGQVKVYQK